MVADREIPHLDRDGKVLLPERPPVEVLRRGDARVVVARADETGHPVRDHPRGQENEAEMDPGERPGPPGSEGPCGETASRADEDVDDEQRRGNETDRGPDEVE